MNIAIDFSSLSGWVGGIDFVKAYMGPMSTISDYKLYVLIPKDTFKGFIKKTIKKILGLYNSNMKKPINDFIDWSKSACNAQIVYYKIGSLPYVLSSYNIDVIFLTQQVFDNDIGVPWIPYLPDFQHKYLTDFFSKNEIESRNIYFRNLVTKAISVIVEANDVVSDVRKFIPEATSDFFVMPYTAVPERSWFDLSKIDVDKYKLPKKYFLVSNQFWVHKNHMVVFEALYKFINKYEDDVHIVCTGNTDDYRNKDYFPRLLERINSLHIQDKIHILGYIPKLDQIKIMTNSIAVIQPTLFEGNPGGGIAYNALALDVPIILSDINVNKELKYEKAILFKSNDSEDLCDKMYEMIESSSMHIKKNDDELIKLANERQTQLVKAIINAINTTVSTYKEKPSYDISYF